jgi:hypothetical protein
MPGKHTTISQVKQVLALRSLGATRGVISIETGVSISTVSRICKRFSGRKGSVTSELIEESRQKLVESLSSDKELQAQAARLVADDLVLGQVIREKIMEGMIRLDMSEPDEVAAHLRALNSASSALLTVQKVGRVATGADELSSSHEELPVLSINVMSEADVEETKEKLRRQANGEDETDLVH